MKQLLKAVTQPVKAMTLVETVVYIGIFAIFLISNISFFLSAEEINRNINERYITRTESIFITNQVNSTFMTVMSIDEANSIFDTDSGKVTYTTNGGKTISYTLQGGRIIFNDGTNSTYLNSTKTNVTKFHISPIRNKDNVIISLRYEITVIDIKRTKYYENIYILLNM